MASIQVPALSPTEGTTFIPFKPRNPKPGPNAHPDLKKQKPETMTGTLNWNAHYKAIQAGTEMSSVMLELFDFVRQDPEERDANFGINEIPTALVVGRDRALLLALVCQVQSRAAATVVRLEEGDCNNSTTALRALVGGFIAEFEKEEPETIAKRKTSTTLAPFDIARLVTAYEDYYRSQDRHTNLVVLIEQFESFPPDVMEDIIYVCSKHLDSLPFLFVITVFDEVYIQQAYTTATRMMLDVTVYRPPSGSSLCLAFIEEAWGRSNIEPDQFMLGESAIKVLKDIIDRTDGRVDGLFTALHLLHIQHRRYQRPIVDAARKYLSDISSISDGVKLDTIDVSTWNATVPVKPEDILAAFITLSKRKLALADGFSPADVKELTGPDFYAEAGNLGRKSFLKRANMARYGLLVVLEITRALYAVGAYRQETPLPYLDLLELQAKGGREFEKYLTWMIKKGFESASSADLANAAQTVLDITEISKQTLGDHPQNVEELLNEIIANNQELDQQAKTNYANRFIQAISLCVKPKHAFDELYVIESSDGLKELIDPAPRSVVLSGLIRPSAYLRCDCCDPEDPQNPETIPQSPDTCALFQRSLEAGRFLNIADWFNAFSSIMQSENVKRRAREPEAGRVRRSASRSRRATSSVHMESDADAEGEVDESLEIQQEHQARFLLSIHELEFLGLIQATARRKEHVLRTVFETGD